MVRYLYNFSSCLFYLKEWSARSLLLFTWLFSSQPESSYSHGSCSLEQHGKIFFIIKHIFVWNIYILIFLVMTQKSLLIVRASGQQDIYTRLHSWRWLKVSLWGNFAVNNNLWHTWYQMKRFNIFWSIYAFGHFKDQPILQDSFEQQLHLSRPPTHSRTDYSRS